MTTTTPNKEAVLSFAAELRSYSCGCEWKVIAWRLEIPEAQLIEIVEESGDWFDRRVEWLKRDRENEEAARRLRDLRAGPEKARIAGRSAVRAWIALIDYVL